MFANETLYFDKSDCEDRAVLFSYLVKELFGVGVVGVKYKDHMATALYVPMSGDSVQEGRRKFGQNLLGQGVGAQHGCFPHLF